MARCHAASGTEMVTLAVRRVNLTDRSKESELDFIDRSKIHILPNTAACYTAEDAIRTARLAHEVGLSNWIKLEVIGDQKTLFPDNEGLLEATRVLVKEGFVVLPYTTDDLVNARKLIDAGAAAVMPLAAPIGSFTPARIPEQSPRRCWLGSRFRYFQNQACVPGCGYSRPPMGFRNCPRATSVCCVVRTSIRPSPTHSQATSFHRSITCPNPYRRPSRT